MTIALIVAAGSGRRLGAGRSKALVEVAGRAMLQWSLEALRATPSVEHIVIAVPPEAQLIETGPSPDDAEREREGWEESPPGWVQSSYVHGGDTRSDSVRRALAAAGPGDTVLVHDAARPLITVELAESVIAALAGDSEADAAIAAAPVTDTIKRAGREGGAVRETLDRGELWSVQTPQVFRRAALERALDVDDETLARATDDAWLVERAGGRVIVVPSPAENLKVTTPLDLRVAELLLAERAPADGSDPA
ncbi:MAG TPA: 2-C-methyl-D-erythritol 4-phosphate cytidylyltransferase [Solirubrobacteraceae bacterium]|jgi:2-C-methyl-D-erythritol 4-phosphate cytidylyltransferase|nr:2-C-methyl-D-erythritol 4-phosphate cytidylyltransferase [Solirubrobacteraceae bacterium]